MTNNTTTRTSAPAIETVKDGEQFLVGCSCGFMFCGHFDSQEMAYAAISTHILASH